MGIKKYKPTSPGRRSMTGYDFAEITTDRPVKKLTRPLRKQAGRNCVAVAPIDYRRSA